jgi:predicted nucleic acid-binding protein
MKGVFVDTGYWIALINPREQLHRRARSESIRLRQERTILVTSEMVLAEFAAYYAGKGNYFRDQQIVAALAHGQHFEQAGFQALLR